MYNVICSKKLIFFSQAYSHSFIVTQNRKHNSLNIANMIRSFSSFWFKRREQLERLVNMDASFYNICLFILTYLWGCCSFVFDFPFQFCLVMLFLSRCTCVFDFFLSIFSSSPLQILHTSPSKPRISSITELIATDRMKEGCHELIDNRQLNYHRNCQATGWWSAPQSTGEVAAGERFEESNFDEVPFKARRWVESFW